MMSPKKYGILSVLSLLLLFPLFSNAQITIGNTQVDTQSVATNLDTPWEIFWGPDDHIWITERYGRVSRLNPETKELTELITINEVHEEGEAGLLGMALHPDFPSTPHVFFVYNYLSGSSIKERLVRYTYQNNTLSSPVTLIEEIDGSSIHNGSRIVFDAQGKILFTTGDASNTSYSQNLNSLNGKILRINTDGTIPSDNPFQDSYVWTYGHRNPQGLVISPGGIIYSSEHGPASDDEVNTIEEGRNYGWPDVKGFCDEPSETQFCEENNVKEPIAAWTPTLAVAGITHYHHGAIPEWNNSLLMVTLKESELVQLSLSDDGMSVEEETVWFDEWFGRLRDICVSPEGAVYVAVSNRDGRGNPRPGDDRIVEFKKSTGTPINSLEGNNKSLKIYPNPVYETSTILIPDEFTGGTLEIFNTEGVKVYQRKNISTQEPIGKKELSKGLYLITIQKGEKKIKNKLVVE